jgi:hypothetical protein
VCSQRDKQAGYYTQLQWLAELIDTSRPHRSSPEASVDGDLVLCFVFFCFLFFLGKFNESRKGGACFFFHMLAALFDTPLPTTHPFT